MKILILGAAGQIPQFLTKMLLDQTDAELLLFARSAKERIKVADSSRETVIDGDVLNHDQLTQAVKQADVVYLNFDRPESTEMVVKVMEEIGKKRLIVAGVLGIYGEVAGEFGKWNERMIGKTSADRKRGINAIENSKLDYTYLRMTWLYDQDGNVAYRLEPKGESFKGAQVTRQAISQYVVDLINHPDKDLRTSMGIVEPGTEDFAKPSFY